MARCSSADSPSIVSETARSQNERSKVRCVNPLSLTTEEFDYEGLTSGFVHDEQAFDGSKIIAADGTVIEDFDIYWDDTFADEQGILVTKPSNLILQLEWCA